MRKSVIGAIFAAAASLAGDAIAGNGFSDRKFIGYGGALVLLALASGIDALSGIVDVFAYIIIALVILNDGYTLIQQFTA